MSLSRRTAALARTFQLAALAVGVPALAIQCSSQGSAPDADDASAPEADATEPQPDAGVDAPAPPSDDAAPVSDGADAAIDAADAGQCFATISAIDGGGPDGEELCVFSIPCGLGAAGLTHNGCTVLAADLDGAPLDSAASGFPQCTLVEEAGCTDGSYDPDTQGVTFACIGCPGGGGRRPAGLVGDRGRGRDALGAYFAEMAWLEAASVRAFVDLAAELAAHGAPASLVDAARASARDEARHARAMTKLARRFGATPRRPRVSAVTEGAPRRSLAALARENAVEGCVRETYGALLNAWQATHAEDPEIRAAMASLAADELRHAALSWEIALWARAHVAPAPLARATRKAIAKLATSAAQPIPEPLRRAAGLPDATQATALARELTARLWAA